jgi:PKD repeat protein
VPFSSNQPETPAIVIEQSDRSSLVLDVTIKGMYSEMINQDGVTFERISLLEDQSTKEVGLPELPMLHQLIGIPDNQVASYTVTDVETIKISGITIYPFQTPTTDNPGGHNKPFVMDKAFYSRSLDYPAQNVVLGQADIWRDVKVAGLHVTPFTYNPATKELEVITHLKVKVTFSGYDSQMTLNRSKELTPKFFNMYSKAIANFDDLGYTQTLRETVGIKYLIITNTEALAAIQPLVDFKNAQGMKVQVRTLETGFNTPQHFKDYVNQLYLSDGLEYVLMVGDAYPNGGSGGGPNKVPMYMWAPGGEDASYSDSWYTCLNGPDDHYADIAIGRFVYDQGSLNELDVQIQKTMTHYLTPDASSNWAENTILIAHKEEYPGKYTLCCEQIRTFPYSVQTPVFTTAYGGAGASNQQVVDFVNNTACGIFNYRGHGSATELWQWGSSGSFTATHVNQLNNVDKLFVFFDVCCDNMDIVAYNGECLCESFMKSPVASVAVNGAIIPSYTIPNHDYDKEMYKAVFEENITNIGYITNFANVTVLNVHGTLGRSNVRTYLWLGDASIEPWTKQPSNLTVSHDSQIFLGLSEFVVTVTGANGAEANAMVCVSNVEGTIYAVAYTDATGVATVVFDGPVQNPGDATVTVTLHNYLPYQAIVPVIPQSGPYVVKDSYTINDASGNNNGLMDYGESVMMSLSVKNVGITTAENVVVTISSADSYVTITDNTENYGNILSNEIITVADGFAFDVADNIPDGQAVLFDVSATDGTTIWTSNLVISGHAPALEFESFIINDGNGNNNGFLDPGETATMVLTVANNGTADAYDVVGLLTSTDPYVTVSTTLAQPFGNLIPDATATASYTVSAAANTPFGYTAQLTINLSASMGISQVSTVEIIFSDYCEASTTTEDEYIQKVVFGEITNTSGWQGGVSDFTGITANLQPGVAVPITITNGTPWASDIVKVWIDWNLNKEFGDANETYSLTNVGGTGASFTGSITAPANQNPGPYRMRIRMTYSTAPVPCGSASYGEIEDYTVIIAGVNANFTANVTSVCEVGQVQFTDNSSGGATSWSWTFEGGTPETSTEQNPLVTYNTAGVYDVTLVATGTAGSGSTTKTDYIAVNPKPAAATAIIGSNQGCQGYAEIYTVDAISLATEYMWTMEPAEAGTALQEGNTCTVTWSDMYEGTATMKVCGVNECGEGVWSEEFLVIVQNCTGIEEGNKNASLSIYPNPTTGNFTVEFNASDVINLKLINTLGEVVYQLNKVETNGFFTKSISVNNISEGVYYLKVEGNTLNINKKIVIKK